MGSEPHLALSTKVTLLPHPVQPAEGQRPQWLWCQQAERMGAKCVYVPDVHTFVSLERLVNSWRGHLSCPPQAWTALCCDHGGRGQASYRHFRHHTSLSEQAVTLGSGRGEDKGAGHPGRSEPPAEREPGVSFPMRLGSLHVWDA